MKVMAEIKSETENGMGKCKKTMRKELYLKDNADSSSIDAAVLDWAQELLGVTISWNEVKEI